MRYAPFNSIAKKFICKTKIRCQIVGIDFCANTQRTLIPRTINGMRQHIVWPATRYSSSLHMKRENALVVRHFLVCGKSNKFRARVIYQLVGPFSRLNYEVSSALPSFFAIIPCIYDRRTMDARINREHMCVTRSERFSQEIHFENEILIGKNALRSFVSDSFLVCALHAKWMPVSIHCYERVSDVRSIFKIHDFHYCLPKTA